jgi:hypothetical protein
MENSTRNLAGVLFIVLPTVAFGGISILTLLISPESGYMDNPLRQDLWRAGHAHAGVFLILSLIILFYVDDANLSDNLKKFVRIGTPIAAIIVPFAFFFSVIEPDATEPNALIYLTYIGFALITITLVVLGIGLLKSRF